MILRVFIILVQVYRVFGTTYEEFEPVWKMTLSKLNNSRLGYSKDLSIFGATNNYVLDAPYVVPDNNNSATTSYSLIPYEGIVDSDVKCGQDKRNFCNYPELPFVETLNIPKLLAGPNLLNRLPSGKCPDGYKKYPTKDCINIAPAFIETTCCVYETPQSSTKLSDYCSNRQGISFTATFELCDGRSYIVAGSTAWQIDEKFKILGGPYSLNILTGGTVSSNVDSALVDSSCNVGFFQGTNLRWMNFPGKTASVDQTLAALLGAIPANLCAGSNCTASAVNFAVCPNNGFCMVSINLTASGTIYRQLFLLAPGFNSFISATQTPPGIAVTNNQDLKSVFQNYLTGTFLRSTSRLAFTDIKNDVYFYDTTGKFLSGPTNLLDLFGVCSTSSSSGQTPITIYVPYPVFSPLNGSAPGAFPGVYSGLEGIPYQQRIPPVYSQQPASYNPPTNNYVQNPSPSYQTPPAKPYYEAPPTSAPAPQYAPQPVHKEEVHVYPVYSNSPSESYNNNPAPPAYQQPSAPTYAPTPAPYVSPPVYQPAPAPTYAPTPAPYTPQPTTVRVYETPAPVYTTPAPQYIVTPAPYVAPPQPAPVYAPSPPFNGYRPPYNTPFMNVPADLAMYVPSVPTYATSEQDQENRDSPSTTTSRPATAAKENFVPAPSAVKKVDPDELVKHSIVKPSRPFFDLSKFIRNTDDDVIGERDDKADQSRLILV